MIQIDSAGLSDIYDEGQTVTLARQVNQVVDAVASPRVSADASQLIVAWLAFEPLETNTIDWSEQYYCFATTTSLTMDEVLEMNSQSAAPMQLGSVYTFDQGQFAAYPSSGSDYVIYNAMAGEYGFGLAQQATVNDAQVFTPICVEPVLTDEAAYFTPTDQISIFLSSASNSGTLIPRAKIALYPQPNPGARWVVGIGYSVAAVQAMQAFAQNVNNNAIYAYQNNLGILVATV